MNWKQIVANSNLVQHETENAVLIKLPKTNYLFWHPKKLVRASGKNNYRMTIAYTNTFKIKIFKTGKGYSNFGKKFDEIELSIDSFESYFNVKKEEGQNESQD